MCVTKVSLQSQKTNKTRQKKCKSHDRKRPQYTNILTNLLEKCQSKNLESWFKTRIINEQQKRKTLKLKTKKIKMGNHFQLIHLAKICFFVCFCILEFYFIYLFFIQQVLISYLFYTYQVYMSISISQFVPPPPPPPLLSPLGVHMLLLCICVSISTLQTSSCVPFFQIPHKCVNIRYLFFSF